ncbi:glycosyltransferase family 4 protein [Novosphingobium humi]|uniref:glycosyltransferase family 4 protein n=1 Tax=Novosphingobium humi TaxID=2282397 RepID=UPI0025AFA246|nr:glycosyltransferase family 4 protein [Novosphingobium humi]WJS99967.1 glycosyltransferase family 4 protein [Novosphingobium humi]
MSVNPLRVLHLHSSFNPGGKELRCVQLINAFGAGVAHTIVSAMPDAMEATRRIMPGIRWQAGTDFPSLQGKPTPKRLIALASAMSDHDLVLTYNFGAMDAVLAHTLFAQILRLPPLVHHEDGFNQDEVISLKSSRNWYRRIALGRTSALVVCSQRLESIARDVWQQPAGKVHRIPNGIRTAAYAAKPRPDALPRVIKRKGELWLGTLAGLRPVKNLPRLVRAFAALPEPWQLVIAGDGPEREVIREEALRLDIAHRVHLPGHVGDPAKVVGLFDLFALSSDSEQFPISVVEAMAAGLAVVSPDVGDVAPMLSGENRPFLVPAGDEAALAAQLAHLAADADLRRTVGQANRALANAEYDEKTMVDRYRALYGQAMGRNSFP